MPARCLLIATLLTIPQHQRKRDRLSWWAGIDVGNSGMVGGGGWSEWGGGRNGGHPRYHGETSDREYLPDLQSMSAHAW